MSRRTTYALVFGALVLGVIIGGVGGIWAFIQLIGGSGAASAPISAPTLAVPASAAQLPTAAAGGILFRIVPEESQARFVLDEIRPFVKGLVGSTNQVAGDVLVDFTHPANSRIGPIRINLRTLQTDDPDRDRVIRGEILQSARAEYEFADFTPTAITGLPASVSVGQPLTFQVTGDFPLRGVSRALTFDVTVTPVSTTRIEGQAVTTIRRADYNLLQSALADHGVSETIRLELQFVARAVAE